MSALRAGSGRLPRAAPRAGVQARRAGSCSASSSAISSDRGRTPSPRAPPSRGPSLPGAGPSVAGGRSALAWFAASPATCAPRPAARCRRPGSCAAAPAGRRPTSTPTPRSPRCWSPRAARLAPPGRHAYQTLIGLLVGHGACASARPGSTATTSTSTRLCSRSATPSSASRGSSRCTRRTSRARAAYLSACATGCARRPRPALLRVHRRHPAATYCDAQLIFPAVPPGRPARAAATCRPRLHDLRHSFAVRTLLDWYRTGDDVQARLPLLSTYLGHVQPGIHVLVSVGRARAARPGRERLERHLGGRP